MSDDFPILDSTWNQLVATNGAAVQTGWAQKGAFATGVAGGYWEQRKRLLYVGKSLGSLAHLVGMSLDHATSADASRNWMETQRNGGARFWQFVQQFDSTRRGLAWTNISKIDRLPPPAVEGRKKRHLPPTRREFRQIGIPCLQALREELDRLTPHVALFVTGNYCYDEVSHLLRELRYDAYPIPFADRWTTCARSPTGTFVVRTRHPHWWKDQQEIQNVTNFLKGLLE